MALYQHSTPKVVLSDGTVSTPTKIEMSGTAASSGYDENWLQDLIFNNPDLLPIEEINRSFSKPISVCREMQTPVGPIDVLYVTSEGKLVLLEAKLWRNPEARREVVGQILDYAKELSRWDYEDLQRQVSQRLQRKGNVLYDIAREAGCRLTEHEFVDEVSRCLSQGDFLLVICGDGIREGTASISEFLQTHVNLRFSFGLVELAMYRLESNDLLVQPRILAKTELIERATVTVRGENADLATVSEVFADESNHSKVLSSGQKDTKEFWSLFLSELQLDDISQPLPKASTLGYVRFKLPAGPNAWITAYRSYSDSAVGVFIRFRSEGLGTRLYQHFLNSRSEIESQLGTDVQWLEEESYFTIISTKSFGDVSNSGNMGEMHAYLAEKVNLYVNIFRPRIERLIDDD